MKGYKIVNRKFSTAVRPLLAAAAILCAVAPAKAAEKEPNIVFMLMDNLGYGELGVYGGGIPPGSPPPPIHKLRSQSKAGGHLPVWGSGEPPPPGSVLAA